MATVADHMEALGLDEPGMAELLSERLGRPVKPATVRLKKNQLPKAWAVALGESPDLAAGIPGEAPAAGDAPSRDAGAPSPPPTESPRPPAGGATPHPPAGIPSPLAPSIQQRIEGTYEMVGYIAELATGNPAFRVVTDDCAPEIAKAWIAAAEENEFARRIVKMMGAGGATSELVFAHVVWFGGLLYVTGQIPGVIPRWRKYDAFIPRRPSPAAEPASSAERNGGEGAGDTVAEPRTAPTV